MNNNIKLLSFAILVAIFFSFVVFIFPTIASAQNVVLPPRQSICDYCAGYCGNILTECTPGPTSCNGSPCESTCGCGRYSKGGAFGIGGRCTDCPDGASCGGHNVYENCDLGSFGRGKECADKNVSSPFCPSCPFGSFQNQRGQTTCKPCPRGSHGFKERAVSQADGCRYCPDGTTSLGGTDSPNQQSCFPCQPGQFSTAQGTLGICVNCSIGFISKGGAKSCSKCPENKVALTSGLSECSFCLENHIPAEEGTRCVSCAAGTSASPGDTVCACGRGQELDEETDECVPCQPGWYNDVSGNSCRQCPRGSFSNASAASFCYDCQPGTYQRASGQTYCSVTIPGWYAKGYGATTGVQCAKGEYQDEYRSTSCKSCQKGQYSSEDGATFCNTTQPGFFALEGASSPSPCAPGTFSNASGASFCYQAPKGYFVAGQNATHPSLCQPGYYSDRTAATSCRFCRPGSSMDPNLYGSQTVTDCTSCPASHFSETNAATECLSCRKGTFMEPTSRGAMHSSQCKACPLATWSSQLASTSCNPCLPGHVTSSTASTSQQQCFPCPKSTFANSNGECQACPGGFMSENPASTSCTPVGLGYYSAEGSSARTACQPGYYCDVPTGCDSQCKFCGDQNGYSTEPAARSCTPCSRALRHVSTKDATGCVTVTESLSTSISHHLSDSLPITVSHSNNTPTKSQEQTKFTPSTSLEETPSRTRHTESRNFTKSMSSTPSSELTETNHRASETHDSTHSPSHLISESNSDTISDLKSPSVSHRLTDTHLPLSETHEQSPTSSMSHSRPKTKSETFRQPPQHPTLGLNAAEAEALKQTAAVTSAVVGVVASAPAAAIVGRSMAVLSLVGCEKKDPDKETYWDEEEVNFPMTLLPGVGFGRDKGKFHRGGVAGFIGIFLLAVIMGLVFTESVGKDENERVDDVGSSSTTNGGKKKKSARRLLGSRPDDSEEENEDDEDNNTSNSNNNNDDDDDDDEDEAVDVSAQLQGLEKAKSKNSLKQNRIPQLVFSVFAAILSLWAPEAGFVFSTFEIDDMLFATIPLALAFAYIIYIHYKVYASLADKEYGIYSTPSFLIKREGTSSIIKFINSIGRAIMSARTASKILTCWAGRFALFGHYFYTRPRGYTETLAAQRVLVMMGSQLQRFRGVIRVPDLVNTTADDENEENVPPQVNSGEDPLLSPTQQQQHRHPDYAPPPLPPPQLVIQPGSNTLSAKIAPFFLLISWTMAATIGFLQGIALAHPEYCPAVQKVVMAQNIVAMLIFLWLRPFVVPLKNYAIGLMELVVCITSILVAVFLFENPFADAQDASNLDLDAYHRKFTSMNSTSAVDPAAFAQKIEIAKTLQMLNAVVGTGVSIIVMVSSVLRFFLLRAGRLAAATQEEMLEMKRRDIDNNDDGEDYYNNNETRKFTSAGVVGLFNTNNGSARRNVASMLMNDSNNIEGGAGNHQQEMTSSPYYSPRELQEAAVEEEAHLTMEERNQRDQEFLSTLLSIDDKEKKEKEKSGGGGKSKRKKRK